MPLWGRRSYNNAWYLGITLHSRWAWVHPWVLLPNGRLTAVFAKLSILVRISMSLVGTGLLVVVWWWDKAIRIIYRCLIVAHACWLTYELVRSSSYLIQRYNRMGLDYATNVVVVGSCIVVLLGFEVLGHQSHFFRSLFGAPKFLLVLLGHSLDLVLGVAVNSPSDDRTGIGWELVDILKCRLLWLNLCACSLVMLLLMLLLVLTDHWGVSWARRFSLVDLDKTRQLICLRLALCRLNEPHALLIILDHVLLHR